MPTEPSKPNPPAVPDSAEATVRVVLPASLTAPDPAEELTCTAATVRELLDAVAATRPDLAGRLLYEGRPLVGVVFNGSVLAPQVAMTTVLSEGDRIDLLPPIAGG
jgi:molybdopterin converting factor small subunit